MFRYELVQTSQRLFTIWDQTPGTRGWKWWQRTSQETKPTIRERRTFSFRSPFEVGVSLCLHVGGGSCSDVVLRAHSWPSLHILGKPLRQISKPVCIWSLSPFEMAFKEEVEKELLLIVRIKNDKDGLRHPTNPHSQHSQDSKTRGLYGTNEEPCLLRKLSIRQFWCFNVFLRRYCATAHSIIHQLII